MTAAASAQTQRCDPGGAVAAVQQRQKDLLREEVPEMSTDVPLRLRPRLVNFKDALALAVDGIIECGSLGESAPVMQERFAKLLGANQPEKPFTPSSRQAAAVEDGIYGGDLKVAVTAPANAPDLRVVVVSLGIECGTDAMLLVYEPRVQGWQRTLRWQSPVYEEISGALGGFFAYAVVPGAPWKIAVAHGTDWCTSRWSSFAIDVLAPTPDAGKPRVVWHQQHGFVLESEPRMVARPDGFELRVDVGTIETEQMVRKGIFRYRVDGDRVERVAPIAVDGRGFVDAWLQAPWSEAQRWSLPEGAAGFEQAHAAFEKGAKDAAVTYAYGPVRACLVKDRYEVEMDAKPGGAQFYAIEERPGGYILVNYATTQDERCVRRVN